MTGLALILVGACVLGLGGVPGLFAPRGARWGEWASAAAMLLGAVLGLVGTAVSGSGAALEAPWGPPWGRFAAGVDPLSAVFLIPVFLVPALGAVYGLGYWAQREHPGNAARLRLFYGLLPAAMAVVLVAREGSLFLVAWEVMAISAFFLVTTEEESREARSAGWIYLVATHVGTLALFAMFALVREATGSFALAPASAPAWTPGGQSAVFVLALVGFGFKAGLMPLHVWLPGAHASAPSHVSAVLSGVMLKMGIYGIVRVTGLLPDTAAWWGGTLLAMGAISAVLALAFALAQHDFKRLLAYSSIENIGIIAAGLGLAVIGRAEGEPAWVALGLGGALLHVWNHSLFKPLLFFGAGSVLHATGTRRMDRLGGLGKRMPATASLVLVGAAAICALPPLNGFVSELLIYLGLFRATGIGEGGAWPWAAAAIPAMAIAGAMAVAAFTKLFGTVFLGVARTEAVAHAHESPGVMLAPMGVLALLCAVMGSLGVLGAPLLDRAIGVWWAAGAIPEIASVAPLRRLAILGPVTLVLLAAAFLGLGRAMATESRPPTWDCAYAAPSPRMQYTGSSLADWLVSLFAWVLRPRTRLRRPTGLFPAPAAFESETPDVVLDRAVLPSVWGLASVLGWARLLQQGRMQVYVLYILLAVLALLVWGYVA